MRKKISFKPFEIKSLKNYSDVEDLVFHFQIEQLKKAIKPELFRAVLKKPIEVEGKN